ncbi:MAG TPA: alpha/beta hydrolase [Iamia sp.]|nr:alpha/beta hydrolase [Iamia sp.]
MGSADTDPGRFTVHHAEVRGKVELAFVREGVGGRPLLLVHGYPETKRIWWRVIEPLAEAGYEVIVPDLRGYGDSGLAADGFYDIAAYSLDLHALVHDVLGHDTTTVAGGDVGGVVLYDLGLRFPGFVTHQVVFNTVTPLLDDVYAAAGLAPDDLRGRRAQSDYTSSDPTHRPRGRRSATTDYFFRQATEPDALLAELDTPERRRAWVAPMYGHRLWGTPDAFTAEEVAFHTEPFADAERLRASWAVYEHSAGRRAMEDTPRMFEQTPVPSLVLYGPEDHVVLPSFPQKMAAACLDCTGPLIVPASGHFVPWEAAVTFAKITAAFCRG